MAEIEARAGLRAHTSQVQASFTCLEGWKVPQVQIERSRCVADREGKVIWETNRMGDAYKRFGLTEEMVMELAGLITAVMFSKEPNPLIVVELARDGLHFSNSSLKN